ncbi:MAG: hypothetical protein ACE5I4_02345 [Thermoplasmata archaeon]
MRKMWAWDLRKDGEAHGRRETELARYFKLEYGEAEVERLLAQTRAKRPPSPGRFRAGLRKRVAGRRQNGGRGFRILGHRREARPSVAVASASASSGGAASGQQQPPATLPVDCEHVEWETLGSGGSTTYLQCKACGALVISQGGRLWSFGRERPEGI